MNGNDERPIKSSKATNFEEYPSDFSQGSHNPTDTIDPKSLPRNERPIGGRGNSKMLSEFQNFSENQESEEKGAEDTIEEETGPLDKRMDSKEPSIKTNHW